MALPVSSLSRECKEGRDRAGGSPGEGPSVLGRGKSQREAPEAGTWLEGVQAASRPVGLEQSQAGEEGGATWGGEGGRALALSDTGGVEEIERRDDLI